MNGEFKFEPNFNQEQPINTTEPFGNMKPSTEIKLDFSLNLRLV